MSSLIDAPLETIQRLWQGQGQEHDAKTDDAVKEMIAHFRTQLGDNWDSVPSINDQPASLQQLAEKKSLVRFRGMIQDTTLGTEVFAATALARDGTKLCNLFSDGTPGTEPVEDSLTERTLLICVDVPGEQPWVKKAYQKDVASQMAHLQVSSPISLPEALKEKVPVLGDDSIVLLVKNYTNDESLQSSTAFEFLGVLDSSALHFGGLLDAATDKDPVPMYTLHMLSHRPIQPPAVVASSEGIQDWSAQRERLLAYLAAPLLGDVLAAEFLFLCLLARVHTRKGLLLGNFVLNLTFPKDDTKTSVSEAISNLLPCVQTLDITIPALNDTTQLAYQPTSTSDSLKAGRLQMTKGAFILADERQMGEGTLQDKGVKNLQALSRMITDQKLAFVFPYSEFDFDTDVGIVVLSRGKSLLPSACVVPVQPQPNETAKPVPLEQDLDVWRGMIEHMKWSEFTMNENVASHIEEDFVNLRQNSANQGNSIGHEDLMLRLAIARLLALSHGQTELTADMYAAACKLDDQRRDRVAKGVTL